MKSLMNKVKLPILKDIESQITQSNAQLPNVQLPSIQLSNISLPNTSFSAEQLTTIIQPGNPQLENPQLENPQLENSQLENLQPENPQLENPQLENLQPEKPQLENPQLKNPQLENPQPINQNQLAKLNQLEQPIIQSIIPQPIYTLENIYNKIKDIGRSVQLIRIERRGIIHGRELWGLVSKILEESEINGDLVSELKNYELNVQILNLIEKRILSINELKTEAFPDYYMNNIVKLYNQCNPSDINILYLMHMGLDIGQLEYIIYKYMLKPAIPCYISKIYDNNSFVKILSMIQNLGRVFKNVYINELPEDKKMFPLLLVKYIQDLFEKMGTEIISQMSKYKINRDKIKLFFEVTMDDDLHDTNNFNIYEEDTLAERVYKVAYKYLKTDFDNQINDYQLSISYKIVFIMLDLYNYDNPHLPINKLIELMFYSGLFLDSIANTNDSKFTTFLNNMLAFDSISIHKLFNLESYFQNNNQLPNNKLMELLNKFHEKIKTEPFSISNTKIELIPEHIKYLPVEITQLYCLIKPKNITDVDVIIKKINEAVFIFSNPTPQNIDTFFNMLKETINLDNVPIISSIITCENDLHILGINQSNTNNNTLSSEETPEPIQQNEANFNLPIKDNLMTKINGLSENDLTTGYNLSNEHNLPIEIEQTAGNINKFKYLKYKNKYLKIKQKLKII